MSYDIVKENIPKFVKRRGDWVAHGSNGSIIILGTDRAKNGPATYKDGLGHINADGKGIGAAAVHIIAGRNGEDPDLKDDRSYLYLSKKTEVDENTGLKEIENDSGKAAAAILKSDCVRIIYRNDLKISDEDRDSYIFMKKGKIRIKVGDDTSVEITDGNVVADVGGTKFSMKSGLVTIDSPEVHLKGGCEQPWIDAFSSIQKMLLSHNHSVVIPPNAATPIYAMPGMVPSLPTSATPTSTSFVIDLATKLGTWKLKATE